MAEGGGGLPMFRCLPMGWGVVWVVVRVGGGGRITTPPWSMVGWCDGWLPAVVVGR